MNGCEFNTRGTDPGARPVQWVGVGRDAKATYMMPYSILLQFSDQSVLFDFLFREQMQYVRYLEKK